MKQNDIIDPAIFRKLFDLTIQIAFSVILIFITLSLLIGIFSLFSQLGVLWNMKGITGSYLTIIADVLTLFILVELSRFLIEFFETKHIRITFLVDATLVFILREVMIMLFQHKVSESMLYALSAFVFVLAVLRIGSLYVRRFEAPPNSQSNEQEQ